MYPALPCLLGTELLKAEILHPSMVYSFPLFSGHCLNLLRVSSDRIFVSLVCSPTTHRIRTAILFLENSKPCPVLSLVCVAVAVLGKCSDFST